MVDSIIEFIKTFLMLFFELLLLFIVVSFIVSLIQQVVSEEKIKKLLSKPNKAVNYILGMIFGAVTPFCSCSTSDEFFNCFTVNEPTNDIYVMGFIRVESSYCLFCSTSNFQYFNRFSIFKNEFS